VGYSTGGAGTGTFKSGAQTTIDATQINIGTGTNATGTFELGAGTVKAQTITLGSGGNFIFTGGRLSVGTFNGTLNQDGGVLAPDSSLGISTINGNYNLASAGILEFDLNGTAAGTLYDRLAIKGLTQLNADSGLGGWLDIRLGYAANPGDTFLIVENDMADPVAGYFRGLGEGSYFSEIFGGSEYTFQISYMGGTGNDVTLTAVNRPLHAVPEPETWVMLLAGLGLLSFIARCRKNNT
ncbi:MAG: Protein containing Planctomycete extracellular domain protein, partial [Gallionellaceae bacterium]